MALTKYALGELLVRNSECNKQLKYGVPDVRGVLNTKGISATKVNVDDRDLGKFLVVRPGGFIFNHRVHDKLGLGYNTSNDVYIFTNDYVAFYVKTEVKEKVLLPDYLYIWYLRPEFDRYMLFKTYGSATLFFNWDNMCELEIELPDVNVQQKYVDVYKAMVANQRSYERGLEDLKLVCDGYIEDLRRKLPCEKIGDFIGQSKEKNTTGAITLEQGINIDKQFITPQRSNDNLFGRQIVRTGQISYCTQLNNANVAVALRTGPDCIVSSVYDVIYVKDKTKLLPEYLMMWLSRSEFGRYVYWASQGTSYEFLSYENLAGYMIPVPDIRVQASIVNIYNVLVQRKEICNRLKSQIKDICPILIKGSLEEGTLSNG